MHLEGPWLSTTGKKKGKRKFASADHARKAREQEEFEIIGDRLSMWRNSFKLG
jgi:hypothetical protein